MLILTSEGRDFAEKVMKRLYDIKANDYVGKLAFIDFEPTLESMKAIGGDTIRANLVKPEVWDRSIEEASNLIEESKLGILVFGSALNLLLFSRTYRESILERLRKTIKDDKSKTYLFAVSTSAFREEIKALEDVADNLMFTRTEEPMRLYLRITKMKDTEFLKEEVEAPLTTKDLNVIKKTAETSRRNLIPIISEI